MTLQLNKLIKNTFLSLLIVSGYCHAGSHITTAEQAINCNSAANPGANDACPYPSDVEKNDEAFKKTLSLAIKKAGLSELWENNGILRGPETPLEPITISGLTWLSSSSCQAHNCGEHYINYLYQPTLKAFVAVYKDGDKKLLIGNPDAHQLDLLQ